MININNQLELLHLVIRDATIPDAEHFKVTAVASLCEQTSCTAALVMLCR